MESTYLKGCITTQKWLLGQTLEEIENRLGFHKGRLGKGAYFAVPVRIPESHEFEFAEYTQVAGHRTDQVYGNINDGRYDSVKESIKKTTWSLSGANRIIKVIPKTRHNGQMDDNVQYPPGSGIPQWVITASKGIQFNTISFVDDYPNGRFLV